MSAFIFLLIWWIIGFVIIIVADAKMNNWSFFSRIKPCDIPLMVLYLMGSWITITYILLTRDIN